MNRRSLFSMLTLGLFGRAKAGEATDKPMWSERDKEEMKKGAYIYKMVHRTEEGRDIRVTFYRMDKPRPEEIDVMFGYAADGLNRQVPWTVADDARREAKLRKDVLTLREWQESDAGKAFLAEKGKGWGWPKMSDPG